MAPHLSRVLHSENRVCDEKCDDHSRRRSAHGWVRSPPWHLVRLDPANRSDQRWVGETFATLWHFLLLRLHSLYLACCLPAVLKVGSHYCWSWVLRRTHPHAIPNLPSASQMLYPWLATSPHWVAGSVSATSSHLVAKRVRSRQGQNFARVFFPFPQLPVASARSAGPLLPGLPLARSSSPVVPVATTARAWVWGDCCSLARA